MFTLFKAESYAVFKIFFKKKSEIHKKYDNTSMVIYKANVVSKIHGEKIRNDYMKLQKL